MEQKWTIHQLERKSDNGFVLNVHWRFAITETTEEGKNYYADSYSVASYQQDENAEDFIPFEDITEEIVVGWVKESLGEEQLASMEASLLQQIESQKNPPIVYGLPWAQTPAAPLTLQQETPVEGEPAADNPGEEPAAEEPTAGE